MASGSRFSRLWASADVEIGGVVLRIGRSHLGEAGDRGVIPLFFERLHPLRGVIGDDTLQPTTRPQATYFQSKWIPAESEGVPNGGV